MDLGSTSRLSLTRSQRWGQSRVCFLYHIYIYWFLILPLQRSGINGIQQHSRPTNICALVNLWYVFSIVFLLGSLFCLYSAAALMATSTSSLSACINASLGEAQKEQGLRLRRCWQRGGTEKSHCGPR